MADQPVSPDGAWVWNGTEWVANPNRPAPQYPSGSSGPYGHGVAQPATNGLAIASLVLGILWLMWVGSVLALIFGYVAKQQIRERGQSGDGMATAGIVLGWIGVGFLALPVVFGLIGAAGL